MKTGFILRGRSIDGTVYFSRIHGIACWGALKHEAAVMTREAAQAELEHRQHINDRCHVDSVIGHLTLVPARKLYGQWRKTKRYERQFDLGAAYYAWLEGESDACEGRRYRNPFPRGRRHDEYKRGYGLADPMGTHHGRNV